MKTKMKQKSRIMTITMMGKKKQKKMLRLLMKVMKMEKEI